MNIVKMSAQLHMNEDEMRVKKRDGNLETISFDKILKRIKTIGQEANIKINYTTLVMKVIDQLFDGICTTKIDELMAEQCASMASIHPDYNVLAGRLIVSNHHKNTEASFSKVMRALYENKDIHGVQSPLVSKQLMDVVDANSAKLDEMCVHNRDYLIDYFGFKTLERAYLMRVNRVVLERIQHMWLRVSIGIHCDDLEKVLETYEFMSQKYFTHATPTLFNSGTPRPQLSSCFLLAMENDSIDGIYNTLKDCALISKMAGGIGLHIHNVRATGSYIRGTNGTSNGIVPMLRVFNNTAKYVDQCLDPDTIVYTKYGAKRIKNIVIGDKVIADDGNYYKIGKILDNEYYGDFYTLDIKHTLYPLKLTDMHPLWTIKNDVFYQRNFKIVIDQLKRNLLTPDFIEVKHIKKNDFVGFPIPRYEKDVPQYTEDDCRFYGIMLGDGNISSVNNLAYVSLNTETKCDTMAFVENYLEKLNIHITYSYSNEKSVRLTWTRSNMFKFTYEMLYDENKEKYVLPSMLHLPKPKILNVIKGILETDGKVTDHQIVLEITSLSIVESVRYMLMRLGLLTSGCVRDRTNETHITKYNSLVQSTKESYVLIIPKKPCICELFPNKELTPSASFTFFEYNGYLFSIVKDNQMIHDYSGRVIDIEVDNDYHHNFLTHNGLVKNGGGKRNGSFAIYLEPWHADIEAFLEMRKNHGDEEQKARDLFYALWIPDLFMKRVHENGKWTLMCPDECPGLADVYGEEFEELYTKYETANMGRRTIGARDLWFKVLDAQMETGTPYLCYKDAANKKSNQKNIGTIKSSNLCVAPETLILTDKGHLPIAELVNQTVNVWNGKEWSEVVIKKTGENQLLNKVELVDGAVLECTPYHKFFVPHDEFPNGRKKVSAHELYPGMQLYNCPNMPHINQTQNQDQNQKQTYGENGEARYVKSIICEGRFADTYCFTEPKYGMGVFNGILTGQCTEIMEVSNPTETAVCNLASIALPTFVNEETKTFDFIKLHQITKIVTKNLNRVIDVNYYPTEKTNTSNMRHRPIGLGVQGLADTFMMLKQTFVSDYARELNRDIFETIYHAALEASCELAKQQGPYDTFAGSPAAAGILQFDMWNTTPSDRYDWAQLKCEIMANGLRNSLLVAPMPTASTSQILGFNECIEPITSNIYSRRTSAGEFILANKYMMKDLIELGVWTDAMKNNIIANNGSIQHLTQIPQEIRDRYRTVWEIPMRTLIDMSADRGAFVCQSQSLNLWLEDPNYKTLTSMHFYAWQKGLKTGIYYLRRRGRHQAQQFTIEPEKAKTGSTLTEEEHDVCEFCSA